MARTGTPPRNSPISLLDVRLWRGSSARLELSRHWSGSQGRQGVIRSQPASRPESRELPPGPVPQIGCEALEGIERAAGTLTPLERKPGPARCDPFAACVAT